MQNILTFVIPVRHQDNARDWPRLKDNLSQTIKSISNQDSEGWKAVIVANHGADLPGMPAEFSVKRVDFPPNKLHVQGSASVEAFRDAVRSDKGRRILAGMLHAGPMGHVMVVDDDDFISRRLTSFVARHRDENGWYIRDGYIWSNNGRLLYRYSNFSHLCGTSHIVRSDLYGIPNSLETADDDYFRRALGSHVFIQGDLEAKGTPLQPLPFPGAVYRTGHGESHSRSNSILRQYFIKKSLLGRPAEFLRRLACLKVKSDKMEREFFGRH